MARTHYSIRRRAALDWACRYLGVDQLSPPAKAVVEEFARSEHIKSEFAADILAALLRPYRRPPLVA